MIVESEIIAILRAASERGLPSLLIGAHALILFGRLRNTVDLDLLVPRTIDRAGWTSCANSATAFSTARTPSRNSKRPPQRAPVDLMFVDRATWERLIEGARETKLGGTPALLPRPEYLVALKLHAASSLTRSKPELDWEDIRYIVQNCRLDPTEESFRGLILRYGGEDALRRICEYQQKPPRAGPESA